MRKWILRVIFGLILLVGLGYVGLQIFINTPRANRAIVERLEPMVGGRVEIGSLSVGFRASSVSDLKLFADGADEPWLQVGRLTLDVSALDLIGGSANPRSIRIRDANVILHVDEEGQLITQFPEGTGNGTGAIPRVILESGRVTIRQDGRPEAVFTGLDAELTPETDLLKLAGTIQDPDWKDWTVTADLKADGSSGTIRLHSDGTRVTPERLRSVPFVPAEVWEQVTAEGDSPADIILAFGKGDTFHYRVEFSPRDATVNVPALGAVFTGVTGSAILDDGLLTIADTTGAFAEGQVSLPSAKLDFREDVTELDFQIAGKGLDVKRFPSDWGFPRQITAGQLDGEAGLSLAIDDDGVRYDGKGTGTIRNAQIVGFPATGDGIGIELTPAEDGFRFTQPGMTHQVPPKFGTDPLPRVMALMALALTQAPDAEPDPTSGLLELTFGLEDVDAAELLRRLEVEVPLKVGGQLTVNVKVGIPTQDATNLANYRLDGKLEMPNLTLEDAKFEQVVAQIRLREGVLTLEEFSARLPARAGTAGSFSGSARYEVSPPGELSARLDLRDIPFSNLAALAGDRIKDASGRINGQITFNVPDNEFSDPSVWSGSGTIRSEQLKLFGLTLKEPTITAALKDGLLSLSQFDGTLEGVAYTGEGEIRLTGDQPFRGRLAFDEIDLALVNRLSEEIRPPFEVGGKLRTEATVSGQLSPLEFEASGSANVTGLAIAGYEAGNIAVGWKIDEESVRVEKFDATIAGGKVNGTLRVPFTGEEPGNARVTFEKLDIGGIIGQIPDLPFPVEGRASGTVSAILPIDESPVTVAFGFTDETALKIRGIPADEITGKGQYEDGVLKFDAEGKTLGGSFKLNGTYPTSPPPDEEEPADEDLSLDLRLENIRLSLLWQALELTETLGPLRGRAGLNLAYRAGNATGTMTVRTLTWNNQALTETLTAPLTIEGSQLTIRPQGRFAGGNLRGSVSVNLQDASAAIVTVNLTQISARTIAAVVPELANNLTGSTNLMIQGRFGETGYGRGHATLDRGVLFGVPVNGLRVPFRWNYAQGGQVQVVGATASVAGGQVRMRGEVRFGSMSSLNARADFTRVNLNQLVKGVTDSSFARGKISGRLELNAARLRSFDDLTGRLRGTIEQAQTSSLPVLDQVARTSPRLRQAGASEAGRFDITLARGIYRVRELSLASESLQLFVTGNVTARNGRLDLEVIANTNSLAGCPLVQLISYAIPIGPVPLAVILDVSQFILNRALQFRVTGTINRPVVRFTPIRSLSEEAVRFFLLASRPLG